MEALPNMDEIDRTILAELQSDARRSNKAIAAAAGVAPSTSLTRIRELETAVQVELSVPSIEGLRTLVLENIASFDGVSDEQTVIVFERRRKPVLAPLA